MAAALSGLKTLVLRCFVVVLIFQPSLMEVLRVINVDAMRFGSRLS